MTNVFLRTAYPYNSATKFVEQTFDIALWHLSSCNIQQQKCNEDYDVYDDGDDNMALGMNKYNDNGDLIEYDVSGAG